MRPTITSCLVAFIAAGTVACGDGKYTTAPTASVAGAYALQKFDGAGIPVEIFKGSASDSTDQWYDKFIVAVNAGTLELDPRGHYNSTFVRTLMGNTANAPYVFRR
jgi:hypothetical protein